MRKRDYIKRIAEMPVDYIKGRWRWFNALSRMQKTAVVSGVALIILIVIPTGTYLYFVRDINNPERLMNRNNTGLVLTDIHGEQIYSFGRSSDERNASLEEIPEFTQQALIASEDRGFYEHQGFSLRNILGALYANVMNRDITRYGGSTITQQLVKNNLLTDRRTFLRKYQELAMSIAIERRYEKEEILEMYFNSVYFGEASFGIIQAAETYFDKAPGELSDAESALLIGLLPAPSIYSPISGDPELADRQRALVLERMQTNDFISASQQLELTLQELSYANIRQDEQEFAHHFTEMVLNELNATYGEEEVARAGFRVTTTLDLDWQRFAERSVRERIDQIRAQGGTNGSLVAIDPTNGEIRSLVGSYDWENEDYGKVNMTTSPRQPGSTFKPLYYAEALEQQTITPATMITDEPKTYGDYEPQNFDFRFRGDISARHALATSLNIPAIEVMRTIGTEEAIQTARRMGLETITESAEVYGLPFALGTAEVELLDMTNAFAAFAHSGEQFNPALIQSIENKFGRTIFENNQSSQRVQSHAASYQISEILADDSARAPTFGSALNISGRDVAVKTGTTNDNRDAWTVGYTPQLAIGVWVGDNENQPMTMGGSAAAGPIWRSAMTHMLEDSDPVEFSRPRTIVRVRICNTHGEYVENFIRGTEPDRCEPQVSDDDVDAEAERLRREREEEERRRQREREAAEQEPEPEPIEEDDDEPAEEDEDDEEDAEPIEPPDTEPVIDPDL